MSGNPLSFLRLQDVDGTSNLGAFDYLFALKFNTNSLLPELKKITLSDLQNLIGSGGNGGNGQLLLNRLTQPLPALSPGTNRGTITLGSAAMLIKLESSEPARIRLYSTYTAATNDLTRAVGSPPPENAGLMAEFVSTAGNLSVSYTPAKMIYNEDVPLNGFVHYVIDCSVSTDFFFTHIKLEDVGGF